MIQGEHLRDWWYYQGTANQVAGAEIVWTGANKATEKWGGVTLRLFTRTWQDPLPDVEVRSLDLVSTMKVGAPFVIAITAE